MKNRINGYLFEEMVLNGLNNLINHEKEINAMNVFPVADGDTGTNMRLTLENGYKKASTDDIVKALGAIFSVECLIQEKLPLGTVSEGRVGYACTGP